MESTISEKESRFQTFLEGQSWNRKGNSLLLAWSGGRDSTLLLYLLKKFSKASVHGAYFNHRLRSEEELDRELHFLNKTAADWNIPLFIGAAGPGQIAQLKKEQGGSIEEWARILRYSYFEAEIKKHSFHVLCTAHHGGDEVETMIQRFFQGAGVMGLRGLQHSQPFSFPLIRPLLLYSVQEIEQLAQHYRLEWSEDSSNQSTDFLRNRLRKKYLSQTEAIFPGFSKSLHQAAEKNRLLGQWIEGEIAKIDLRAIAGGFSIEEDLFLSLPPALRMELLFHLADKVLQGQGRSLRIPYRFFRDLIFAENLISIRRSGHGLLLRRFDHSLHVIVDETPESSMDPQVIPLDKKMDFRSWSFLLSSKPLKEDCLEIQLQGKPLLIRYRENGDVWKKPGALKKALSRWPREERNRIPLLAAGNRVLALLTGSMEQIISMVEAAGDSSSHEKNYLSIKSK